MSDLAFLTATQARALFRARQLSPVELLDAVLVRADEVNGHVNAFTEELRDEARAGALASERRYATGAPTGALDGIPLALKDEHPIAGRPYEEGSLLLKGAVADKSHPVVDRVLAAGAVVHARTTTPEFSCVSFTHTKLHGVTRNPWGLRYSPGGSSGGAASALAAGMTTLASGSDIGGSIRQPASLCGVVGFKPPFGRVPGLAPFSHDSYCSDGPLGRSVSDVALLQNVLAGPHPADITTLRPAYELPTGFEDVTGMRIALCLRLGEYVVDAAVEANTRAVADALRDAGAVVEEVELPWSSARLEVAAMAHYAGIFGASLSGEMFASEEVAGLLMPYTLKFIDACAKHSSSGVDGLMAESELYEPLGHLLEGFDALVCPTFAAQGLVAGDDYVDSVVSVGDTEVTWEAALMTLPFNVLGRLPVLNVPSGLAPNGIPTGVQIVGRSYDDVTTFRVGAAVETALGPWSTPSWRASFAE